MQHIPLLLAALLASACSTDEPPAPEPPAPEPQPEVAAPTAPTEPAEPAFAPVTPRRETAAGSRIAAPGAVFVLPPGWISEPPSSSMRLAQARIPGPAGEAQLTVFYFGAGGGGGVEENLQRWIGQVDIEPGTEPRRDAFAAGDFQVTWVDVAGTLLPSTMGSGPSSPQAGSRMLAAVVEGAQGPWFFKATGPADTLAAERDAFLAMLRGLTPHD